MAKFWTNRDSEVRATGGDAVAGQGTRPNPKGGRAFIASSTCLLATFVLAACGGGVTAGSGAAGTGGGQGNALAFSQFTADTELSNYSDLEVLRQFGSTGTVDQLSASDCQGAGSDVARLSADTSRWPSLLAGPMGQAEQQYNAAVAACSAQDYTTMTADLGQGDTFREAAKQAETAHCTLSTDRFDAIDCS